MSRAARTIILCYIGAIVALAVAVGTRDYRRAEARRLADWHTQNCAAAQHGYDPNYSPSHVKEACE